MPVGIFKNPMGGLSPLGLIVAAVSGVPQPINANVGPQSEGSNKFASRYKQLRVSALPTNTKNVYLIFKGQGVNAAGATLGPFAGPNADGVNYFFDTRYIIDEIPPGESRTYPDGSLLMTSSINVDQWVLDNDVDGEGAYCSVIWG